MTKSELGAARTEAWKNNDWQLASRIQMVLNKMDGLLSAATMVRDRLTRLIDGLKNEGVLLDLNLAGHSFNTLGEIQGSGSEVDRLGGELGMAIDLMKELKRDRADAVKSEHVPTPAEQRKAAAREESGAGQKPGTIGVQEVRALGRQARKLGRPVEQALTGDPKVDAHIREAYEAAGKEPKTLPHYRPPRAPDPRDHSRRLITRPTRNQHRRRPGGGWSLCAPTGRARARKTNGCDD